MIQRRVFVTGQVHGVGFRRATAREAEHYPRLRGFVRNLSDGRVEAVFAGAPQMVLEMVAWCRQGPSYAQVTQVEVIEESVDPTLPGFQVVF